MLNFKFQYINVVYLVQRSPFTIVQFPIIFKVLGQDDVNKHTQCVFVSLWYYFHRNKNSLHPYFSVLAELNKYCFGGSIVHNNPFSMPYQF